MTATATGPTQRTDRITNLDTVRGVATLGILVMNIVAFGLSDAAYFNVDADGSDSTLDLWIGALGEIFFDQKMMAIFSLLFGAGIALFADRTEAKGGRPVVLSLWRNLLLFGIGFLHGLLWEGDILTTYAVCSVFLIALRKRSPRTLIIVGTILVVSAVVLAFLVDGSLDVAGRDLGYLWFDDGATMSDAAGLWFLWEFGARAAGLMLIGVGMYKLGFVQGTGPAEWDAHMVRFGFGFGLPLAVASWVWIVRADFLATSALPSHALNTLATIPMALGWIGLITRWNRNPETWLHRRVRAVGRMALTNYLTQTMLGLGLVALLGDDLGRVQLLGLVVLIWTLQLVWSRPWLERFTMGPFEWLWRVLTYRKVQPIRRPA